MALQSSTLLWVAIYYVINLSGGFQTAEGVGRLSLTIDNIQTEEGNIHVAIYDKEEHFKKSLEPSLLKICKSSSTGRLNLDLDSIPHGRYALAIYHDENGNGDLDKNLLGIPKEPYGFSNNPRAKWSAPSYEETSFELGTARTHLLVSLKKWKER